MEWSIGIDVGGTNIAAGLVDQSKTIVDSVQTKTRVPRPAASIVDSMVDLVHALLRRNNLMQSDLRAIGVGLPGVVDPARGLLLKASNLHLVDVDMMGLLRTRFPQTPVAIGNDADCAAWGEWVAGDIDPKESVLLITLGTGLGGGFITNGTIFRGGTGCGIEPGHITVVADGGLACTCGRTGCLECYTTIRGMKYLVGEALADDPSSVLWSAVNVDTAYFRTADVFEAARQGDRAATTALDRYVHYLALGLRTFDVLYRPHRILLGGGISYAGDQLLTPLIARMDAMAQSEPASQPKPIVALSRLGNDAGIIGAAYLIDATP